MIATIFLSLRLIVSEAIYGLYDIGLKYSTMIVEVVKNEFFTKTTINS